MTTPATEQNPVGISKEDTPANRAALRVALLTVGRMTCMGDSMQDTLSQVEGQRGVAEETGLPYVPVRLVIEHFLQDGSLTVEDLDEWDSAGQWVRDVTREAVAELKARWAIEKAERGDD